MAEMGDAAKLRLARSRNIGPVAYAQLMMRFGSAEAALDAIPDLARRGGGRAPKLADMDAIEAEMANVARLGARYLFLGDSGYPAALAEIPTAPPALIIRGEAALLQKPIIAMVGARNASAAARRFARDLAFRLGAEGYVVVSGLARGIDTAAHTGSLESGTIAVIAGGTDIFYPPENEELQVAISERGLLIAEQPPGSEPKARHFPYRNRIIAGLGRGTVVVEAAPKSGSLITARQANEFGRDVMAVPGSPLDPRAQGCNQLIRDGAALIQSAEDVIASLDPFNIGGVREPGADYSGEPVLPDASDSDRETITELLGPVPVSVDEIVRQAGLSPAIVQTVLLELELAGRLERHAGGKVSLT
ncbi:DNA-processing protein DprA [Parasphingopyxis marina]|uniref:DNA-protecting protein DprA n=1 Tax=Parasphingopyxis marina TaxID=2761622 RepID=A0A842HYV1_9SPHN|nr:DNA-processing protein DprA [Parasphingopyxis marina]MBC2777521.1 DNA-protecting protein DprA [Parasphingopyxis marina]